MNARTWEGAQVALLDVDATEANDAATIAEVLRLARIKKGREKALARIAAGACTGCARRERRPGLKTCGECSASVSRAREREKQNPKPKPVVFFIGLSNGNHWQGPTLLEASDDDAEGVFRRDADCARRAACEDDWIERANASGDIGTQARCPAVCACYSNRWRQVL